MTHNQVVTGSSLVPECEFKPIPDHVLLARSAHIILGRSGPIMRSECARVSSSFPITIRDQFHLESIRSRYPRAHRSTPLEHTKCEVSKRV